METEPIEDPLLFGEGNNQTNTVDDDDDPEEDNKDDEQDKEALKGTKMNTETQTTEISQENSLINLTKTAAAKRIEVRKYCPACVIAMLQ